MSTENAFDIRKLNRRTFLKLAGGAVAAASALGILNFNHWKTISQKAHLIKYATQCQGCGANRCGIFVYTKNGRVCKVEGNPIANNNLGYVCTRGHGYIHELYNPARIKQPLKKTKNGKFEPISWEQAFSEISIKLNEIILENGPQSLFWLQYPMANASLAFRFMHALGSPNTISHGSTCYTARNAAFETTYGSLLDSDIQNSNYIITIGRNPCGGIKLYQMRELMLAKENGAKLIVVDPRHSETAVIADRWLPIKPGTDLAFLLSMLNIIIKEGLYDKEFVEKNTVGFDVLADEIDIYPPEWAEKICDIPKDTIYQIARDFASHKPKSIIHRGYHGGYGAAYINSFQTARAVAILNAVIGNYEQIGGSYKPLKAVLGELKEGGHPAPMTPTISKADGAGIPGRYPAASYSDGITHAIPELALSGELKAGFVYHNNPVRTNPNPKRVIAGYKKLELLVSIDTVISETAALAHYILPESFYLERDDSIDNVHIGNYGQVSMVQKVVEPIHDTKPLIDIITELSKRLGIGRFFNFTIEEHNNLRLKPFNITTDELKKVGIKDVTNKWTEGFKPCSTHSKKIEIFSQTLKDWGVDPLPRWQEPLVSPDKSDIHSFRLLHGKQAIHTHSMTANIPILMEISSQYNMMRLWVNTKRGAEIGLKTNDEVMIESTIGKGRIKVRLTEGIHPSCVWLPSGYGIFSKYLDTAYNQGISYNDFLPTYYDPVVGHAMTNEVIVRVTKS